MTAQSLVARARTSGTPRSRRGAALLAVLAVILIGLFFKNQLVLFFRPGDTIHATFSQNYGLLAGQTHVKMAGLQVGVVSDVHQDADGTTHVAMKIDHGVKAKLGSSPGARVEPLTVLGGEYAVNLVPGGTGSYSEKAIPVSHTHVPVELDQILAALPSPTRTALQGVVQETGQTLSDQNQASLRALVHEAPNVLNPSTTLLTAVQGTKPATDLPGIVGNVEKLAAVLDEQQVAVARSLTNLDTTTAVLSQHGDDLSRAIANLPDAMSSTRAGTANLKTALDKLGVTATALQPTVARAVPLMNTLEPTLEDAQPVAAELPGLLQDARPLVQQLIPVAQSANSILADVKGPVIDRINGPILSALGHTYRGTGPFKDTGGGIQADNKFYQEIAYMVTNLDRASMTQDAQGSLLNFQAGVSAGSLAPLNLDDALAKLLPQTEGR